MTKRFEPTAAQYGKCRDCGIDIPTLEESMKHMDETIPSREVGGSSHKITVINPPREHRIRGHIAMVVSDAVTQGLDEIIRDIDRGNFSIDEVTEALHSYPDFGDAWADYVADEVA